MARPAARLTDVGMERGPVWLSLDPEGAALGGTVVHTPETIYETDFS